MIIIIHISRFIHFRVRGAHYAARTGRDRPDPAQRAHLCALGVEPGRAAREDVGILEPRSHVRAYPKSCLLCSVSVPSVFFRGEGRPR